VGTNSGERLSRLRWSSGLRQDSASVVVGSDRVGYPPPLIGVQGGRDNGWPVLPGRYDTGGGGGRRWGIACSAVAPAGAPSTGARARRSTTCRSRPTVRCSSSCGVSTPAAQAIRRCSRGRPVTTGGMMSGQCVAKTASQGASIVVRAGPASSRGSGRNHMIPRSRSINSSPARGPGIEPMRRAPDAPPVSLDR